jgi:hypothetical protein
MNHMKKFVLKTAIFVVAITVLFFSCLFLPVPPRTSKSLLMAAIKKDSLLLFEESPRIIFVGGSNLSFGLDSHAIRDSLNLNPVNTAIHASFGMKYMLDNTFQYIRAGDVIVTAFEYSLFYRDYESGSIELLRMVTDVDKSKIRLLSLKQLTNCMFYTGNVVVSKFNPLEYLRVRESDVYGVNSFNRFGDVDAHRNLENREFDIQMALDTTDFNPRTMEKLKEYEEKIRAKGAMMYVSYPAHQNKSFQCSLDAIKKVEKEFVKRGFTILGTPERYMIDDSLMFDSPYHPNKRGLEIRTQRLIEDLKNN